MKTKSQALGCFPELFIWGGGELLCLYFLLFPVLRPPFSAQGAPHPHAGATQSRPPGERGYPCPGPPHPRGHCAPALSWRRFCGCRGIRASSYHRPLGPPPEPRLSGGSLDPRASSSRGLASSRVPQQHGARQVRSVGTSECTHLDTPHPFSLLLLHPASESLDTMETALYKYLYVKCAPPKLSTTE